MNGTEARLARIRGRALAKTHNARTIAAPASNPGCERSVEVQFRHHRH